MEREDTNRKAYKILNPEFEYDWSEGQSPAWKNGWGAGIELVPLNQNPYQRYELEYNAWRAGHLAGAMCSEY